MPNSGRRATQSQRSLSATLLRNARTFYAVSWTDSDPYGGRTTYCSAIAIELGLKAYLLHRGFSDDWNRVYLRHNLTRALLCARLAGLRNIPADLRELADVLGPLYASGYLRSASVAPELPFPSGEVDRIICDLLDSVEAVLNDSGASL